MTLTHYFPNLHQDGVISTQELFTLITEYEPEEQQALAMRLLCSPGRALRRFNRFDDYMQRRIQTEGWLYSAFLAMGGKPVSRHPFYLILGKNERLKCDFGPGAGELILDTTQINAYDLSFTLGDSIGLYFSSATKKLYSLEEIESISLNTAFVQAQMASLEPYHRYIEAQLWDKQYLNVAQIIRYYPAK